jgi:hypothetical protein
MRWLKKHGDWRRRLSVSELNSNFRFGSTTSRSMSEARASALGRFDPFAARWANGRYLRILAIPGAITAGATGPARHPAQVALRAPRQPTPRAMKALGPPCRRGKPSLPQDRLWLSRLRWHSTYTDADGTPRNMPFGLVMVFAVILANVRSDRMEWNAIAAARSVV